MIHNYTENKYAAIVDPRKRQQRFENFTPRTGNYPGS